MEVATAEWRDLSSRVRGAVPSPRSGHSLVAAGGCLYLHSGDGGAAGEVQRESTGYGQYRPHKRVRDSRDVRGNECRFEWAVSE